MNFITKLLQPLVAAEVERQLAERLAREITLETARQVNGLIPSVDDVIEAIDLSDLADKIASDCLNLSEIAGEIDLSDLAGEIDLNDLSHEFSYGELAAELDMESLESVLAYERFGEEAAKYLSRMQLRFA